MPSIEELVRAATVPGTGAARPAARLMTLVTDEPTRLPEIYQAAARVGGLAEERLRLPRLLVGVTGSPGSGKSTLTDGLVRHLRQHSPDSRLGVVAVDPSSPFTGGAVLGDRVRMTRHSTDPMVFVRSMASRGHLGGLALGVKGVVRVLGLLGCEVVLMETVGVGQSEVEVAGVADVVMIVMAPGQGDSVQLLKAGLMEIGDLFVVNKADRPEAANLHSELVAALGLAPSTRPGTVVEPATFLVSAQQGDGVAGLADALEDLAGRHGDHWQARRQRAIEEEVREAVLEEAARRVLDRFREAEAIRNPVTAILEGSLSVGDAAEALLGKRDQR
jgi:LAO/AO transport system kinase